MSDADALELAAKRTEAWLRDFVIAHNLCPFAKKEFDRQRIRFSVTNASTEHDLLLALHEELSLLQANAGIETTLVIHPKVLTDFEEYNQFLDLADALLLDQGWEGEFQIASFHPDYCFAETRPQDPTNKTNRAPFPMLHVLRETSVEKAVSSYPDIEQVPVRNKQKMRELFSD